MSLSHPKCHRCGRKMIHYELVFCPLGRDWCPNCLIQIDREEDGRSSCWERGQFIATIPEGWLVAGVKEEPT